MKQSLIQKLKNGAFAAWLGLTSLIEGCASSPMEIETSAREQIYSSAVQFLNYEPTKLRKFRNLNCTNYLSEGIKGGNGFLIFDEISNLFHIDGTGEFVDVSSDGFIAFGYQIKDYPLFGGYRINYSSRENNLAFISEPLAILYEEKGGQWKKTVCEFDKEKLLRFLKNEWKAIQKQIKVNNPRDFKEYIQEGKIRGLRFMYEQSVDDEEIDKYLELAKKIKEKYPPLLEVSKKEKSERTQEFLRLLFGANIKKSTENSFRVEKVEEVKEVK